MAQQARDFEQKAQAVQRALDDYRTAQAQVRAAELHLTEQRNDLERKTSWLRTKRDELFAAYPELAPDPAPVQQTPTDGEHVDVDDPDDVPDGLEFREVGG